MKFTPRVELKENASANPLDHQIQNENDVTKVAQEAILAAIASETDAINQYMQISNLVFKSEDWLKNSVDSQLEDILNEEKKHLAQLTTIASTFPSMKEHWEDGVNEVKTGEDSENKEEVKESLTESLKEEVAKNRNYDIHQLCQVVGDILENEYEDYDDSDFEMIETFFKVYEGLDELTPEQVDLGIHDFVEHFNLSPELIPEIERQIMEKVSDPFENRREEFKSDVDLDVSQIESLIDNCVTLSAKQKLKEVISYLQNIEYNGEDSKATWNQYQLDKNGFDGNIIG